MGPKRFVQIEAGRDNFGDKLFRGFVEFLLADVVAELVMIELSNGFGQQIAFLVIAFLLSSESQLILECKKRPDEARHELEWPLKKFRAPLAYAWYASCGRSSD